jgi:peptide/nickel transport system substrate-binding protein
MKVKEIVNYIMVILLIVLLSSGVYGCYTYGQQVKVFRVGWGGTSFDTFNPFTTYAAISSWSTLNVYSRLVRIASDLKSFVPDLAEKWEVIGDNTVRFHLVKNATFHDGKSVTAYDVEYSFKLSAEPWSARISSVKMVKEIKVVDSYTIEFDVTSVPLFFTEAASTVPIVPKHIWSNVSDPSTYDANPPIGSGPLKVTEYKEGQYIVLEPYKNFYYKKWLPKVDRIIIKFYSDVTSATNALLSGEVDAVGPYIPISLYETLAKNPQFKVFKSPGTMYFYLAFNVDPEGTGNPTLRDRLVRKALAYAINIEYLCSVAWPNYSKPIANPLPTSNIFYNSNLKVRPFNQSLAVKILDEAGYRVGSSGVRFSPDGVEMKYTILVPNKFPEAVNAAQLIAKWWSSIGVSTTVKPMDTGSMSSIIWQKVDDKIKLGHDIDLWDWFVDPISATHFEVFVSDRKILGISDSGYNNSEYDNLFNKIYEAKTMDELKDVAYKLQEMVYKDLPYLPLCEIQPIQAHNAKFTGFDYNWPGGPFSGSDWRVFISVAFVEEVQPTESTRPTSTSLTTYTTYLVIAIVIIVAVVALLFLRRRG